MTSMKTLEEIKSICPECYKRGEIYLLDALIVEENHKIWIIKKCDKHGSFKEIFCSDVELYSRWLKYKVTGDVIPEVKMSVFNDSLLYDEHISQTILTNLVITNRCNQSCSYCNINAVTTNFIYEPTLDQLRELMQQSRRVQPMGSKAIQITGGEPTLRDDLFEIIRMARVLGFAHIQVHTNGLKLAENIEYCQRLKDEKVNTVHLSFNGLTKSTNELIEKNKKAIKNLRKANLNIILVPVMIGGKNINEAGKIVRFAFENRDIIRGVNFQPISFCGRASHMNDNNRERQRVDIPTLIKIIEKEFHNQISRKDFYPLCAGFSISHFIETIARDPQLKVTVHPSCGGSTFIVEDKGKPLPITRFIDVEDFIKFHEEQIKKKGPLKKLRIFSAIIKNIDTFIDYDKAPDWFNLKQILLDAMLIGSQYALRKFDKRSLTIGFMWHQDPWNLNIDRLKRCVIHCPSFEGLLPFCTYYGLGYGEKIHKKYSINVK